MGIFSWEKVKLNFISSDRKEIRTIVPSVTNDILDPAVSEFISDIESSVYFKEYAINFGHDIILPAVNIFLNKDPLKHEVLFKLLNPLPLNITENLNFKVVEEISDALTIPFDYSSNPR